MSVRPRSAEPGYTTILILIMTGNTLLELATTMIRRTMVAAMATMAMGLAIIAVIEATVTEALAPRLGMAMGLESGLVSDSNFIFLTNK